MIHVTLLKTNRLTSTLALQRFLYCQTVPQFREWVAGQSVKSLGLDPRSFRTGIVMNEVAVKPAYLLVILTFCFGIIPLTIYSSAIDNTVKCVVK
jgi:hypothetical protein